MKKIILIASLMAPLMAPLVALAAPPNNASTYVEPNGDLIAELNSEGGRCTVNGNVLELINGKLLLNQLVVYKGKGVLKVRLAIKPATAVLQVNGKEVRLPANLKILRKTGVTSVTYHSETSQ